MIVDQVALGKDGADHRDPIGRLTRLLDPYSMTLLHDNDDDGAVQAVCGAIEGEKVFAYCSDARAMGGAMTAAGCRRIADTIDLAVAEGRPVIGLLHSGGANLAEGVDALDGVGRVFAAMIEASGRIPQISVVLGAAAGGAAYGSALTDLVIMSDEGQLFVTGPDVIQAVTGEQIDKRTLGGPEAHGRRSGVTHVTARSEAEALAQARQIAVLLARRGQVDLSLVGGERDYRSFLPETSRRAYDVRPLLRELLDSGPEDFVELQRLWAPNIVIGLGRLGGRTIGVIANNPLRKGGCLDSLSAEKGSRFVRMCDALGVPLLVVVDVPGYLPGVGQEWGGVIRRGAKLLHAFGEAVVPRVTLITRKCYGGAYIAMNSRALGATAVLAWPEAEIAVMGAEAAVGILHRRALAAAADSEREDLRAQLTSDHEQAFGGVQRAVALGLVDEVIEPAHTRRRLAELFAGLPLRRGDHRNIPL
ncbi:MAG TPA: carboxyl transferase domain-containing protein [Nonomuraea sp.]|nr:carboxyl transferase domain-containing protein [Nonomuraea sp.]